MAMALPLGKLSILVGAGLLGSVLAKKGQMPSVSGILSGAFKILMPLKTNPASSSTKPNKIIMLSWHRWSLLWCSRWIWLRMVEA